MSASRIGHVGSVALRVLLGLVVGLVLVLVLAVYVLAPVEPVAWQPAPNPGLSGDFAANTRLGNVERLLQGAGSGPEAIACGPGDELFTGLHDGRILAFDAAGDYRELADTGGRPLGMKLDGNGQLIVADAVRGLLSVSPAGKVTVLTDAVNGQPLLFADDVDIAANGTIWFSDASLRYGYDRTMLNFMEGSRTGRLLSYNPATGETRIELEGLFFANGVALGPDDNYVLVNETGAGTIRRLWLRGDKAGQSDLFHPGMPGTPDNLTFNGSDTFWVAMPSLRSGIDRLAAVPLLRRALSLLPPELLGAETGSYSFVVALELDGSVRHNLQDSDRGYVDITSAIECGGYLYLGSLTMPAVARLPLPANGTGTGGG